MHNELKYMQIERKYTIAFDSEWPLGELRQVLHDASRIVLVAHTNADGDAVGALTGMYSLLLAAKGPGTSIVPLLPDGVPDDLDWLPNTDKVLDGRSDTESCQKAIMQADLIIGLDISGFGRTGTLETPLREASCKKMLVDHHESPERDSFSWIVSEPEASSTCELVYWLMSSMFGKGIFATDSATCLYTGLCTDTGTFSYSNDRQSVYVAAAELLAYGIDPMYINRQIKNVFTTPRMQFFGFAISERLHVYTQQGVALMVLSDNDMSSHGVESHELTGLINEVMRLRAIDCGILVREEKGKVRLSLRSKEQYDVNQLAHSMFGGGGHRRAAGATSTLSLEETVEIVKQTLGLEE